MIMLSHKDMDCILFLKQVFKFYDRFKLLFGIILHNHTVKCAPKGVKNPDLKSPD